MKNRSSLAVGLLTLVLLTFALGSYGLIEDNEARFFEISWEMARGGDWLTPHLNFIEHFHKPPGTFWLVGASLRAWGPSEWAGRLPVALAAMLTVWLTWSWTAREGDRDQANRAVLILVTSVEFWFLSRLVLTDMFLTVAVTSAFYWAWRARSQPGGRSWLWFWLSMVATALFKGHIGLAIVFPVLAVFHLTSPRKLSWNLRPLLGVSLFLGLSLPWYVLVCSQNEGLLDYFLRFQTAQRMLTTVHGRPGPWWFYLPVLLAGFFPWSAGLPVALLEVRKSKDDLDRLLLLWILIPVVFFSCAGSKLPTYLLPIFPALAMLVARGSREPRKARLLGSLALSMLAVLALALVVYLSLGVAPILEPAIPYLAALAVITGLGPLLALGWRSRLDAPAWLAWPGWCFALGLLVLACALGPSDQAFSSRGIAQAIKAQQPAGGDLVEVADHLHGLPYYLDQRLIQVSFPREVQFQAPEDYQDFLYPDLSSYFASRKMGPSTLLVVRRSDYETYADPAWPHWEIGHWILLRPRPSSAPALPQAPPPTQAGTLGGGAGLQ